MILKDVSLCTPQENILYDEVLFHLAEKGTSGEVLRFWESTELFVVLGRISKEKEDLKLDAIAADHIPVLRRCSGGGTVLQGKGCLNYSLVLSKARDPQISDLRSSYRIILNKVIGALRQLDVNAVVQPVSDIALAGNNKKISGNAQKRGKKFILHHGTILYDFDLRLFERYLKIPKDIPAYRQGRTHQDFVTNLTLSAEEIKNSLKDVFRVDHEQTCLDEEEIYTLQVLLEERCYCKTN